MDLAKFEGKYIASHTQSALYLGAKFASLFRFGGPNGCDCTPGGIG